MVGPSKSRPPMSHRKTDLGIPCRSKSAKVVLGGVEMDIFRRKVPVHYIPIHEDNIGKKNWVILLEAGTIVGPSTEKLRVAKVTRERIIVTKYDIFLRKQHYLVIEEYDPSFILYIFVRNSTNPTVKASSSLLRATKSANWLHKQCKMACWKSSHGMTTQTDCKVSPRGRKTDFTSIVCTPRAQCLILLCREGPRRAGAQELLRGSAPRHE